MTAAQQKMAVDIVVAGTKTYNGRARRTVEMLAKLGLIEFDYDQRASAKGNGVEVSELFVCRPLPDARERLIAMAGAAVREQWAKFDEAQAAGVTGAPLVRIDQKLRRLDDEQHALVEALS